MPSFRRFIIGLLTAVPLYLAIAGASLWLDARGILAPVFPGWPELCGPGIRDDRRNTAPYLSLAHQPREILFGTSRVVNGFAQADADRLLHGPAVNLALDGAAYAEADAMIRASWDAAPVERVWLGLDYSMFAERGDPQVAPALVGNRKLASLIHGAAPGALFEEVKKSVRTGRWCAPAGITPRGFRSALYPRPAVTAAGLRLHAFATQRSFQSAKALGIAALRARREATQRQLDGLLAESARRNIAVVLFFAPTHEQFGPIETAAGLSADHRQWMDAIAAIARRYPNVRLLALSRDDPVFARQPRQCASVLTGTCLFSDLTHYRPAVGRRILELGIAPGDPGRP